MINYDQKPHCFKCYWRNFFTDNQPAGTVFVNSENTAMYMIVNQNPPKDDDIVNDLQKFYSIIDLQSMSIIAVSLNLSMLLTFLCEHKCMSTYVDTQVQYRYVRNYDNCVCDCSK